MSQGNVETVDQALEAWNRRDFDAAVRAFHEDAEVHFIGGFADLVGEQFHGREAIHRLWRDILGTIGGRVAAESTLEEGERVLVVSTLEGAGAESGAPTQLRFGQLWTFREGKVIRLDFYYEPAEALEAAGLRE